jgi:hypothetical protein
MEMTLPELMLMLDKLVSCNVQFERGENEQSEEVEKIEPTVTLTVLRIAS